MMLMALSFIFGPLRSVSMGVRVVTGISFGFLFYVLDQIFGPLSGVWIAADNGRHSPQRGFLRHQRLDADEASLILWRGTLLPRQLIFPLFLPSRDSERLMALTG